MKVSTIVQYQNASVDTKKVACLFEQRFKEEFPEQCSVSINLYCVPEQNRVYGVVDGQEGFVYRTSEPLDSPTIVV